MPFVGKATIHALQSQIDYLKTQVADGRQREDALVARIHEMKRQGFTAPESAPLPPAAPTRLDPAIEAAIAANMNPTGDAARSTARAVRDWVAQNVDTDTIVRRIYAGAGDA